MYSTLLLILGCIFISFPLFCFSVSRAFANHFDIKLHEGGCSSYFILGYDISNILYNMFMMTWMAVITIPLGIFLICLSIVLKLI